MLLLILSFGLIATSIPVSKLMVNELTPLLYVGIRMTSAGFLLGILSDKKIFRWSFLKRHLVVILYITLLITLVPALLKAFALKHLTSSVASFFRTLAPFLAVLYGRLFFKTVQVTPMQWAGMLIGWLGFSLVVIKDVGHIFTFDILSYAALAGLLAVALVKLGWMVLQQTITKEQFKSREINALTMLLGGGIALSMALCTEDVIGSLQQACTLKFAGIMLYTILIGTVVAYSYYGHCLKSHSALSIALIEYTIPLFVHFYGWVLLGEALSYQFFIGMVTTLFGLGLFHYEQMRREFTFNYT